MQLAAAPFIVSGFVCGYGGRAGGGKGKIYKNKKTSGKSLAAANFFAR